VCVCGSGPKGLAVVSINRTISLFFSVRDSSRHWADVSLTAVLQKLAEDKVALQRRRDILKRTVQDLSSQYEALKTQLNENETYVQVGIVVLFTSASSAADCCDEHVCESGSPSVSISLEPHVQASPYFHCLLPVTSVFLWWRSNTVCISRFVDDVIFS